MPTTLKIATIVPNPCDPDYRVVKQAEALARVGHEVRVYCGVLAVTPAPDTEVMNGVTYIRRAWLPINTLTSMLIGQMPFSPRMPYAPAPSAAFPTVPAPAPVAVQVVPNAPDATRSPAAAQPDGSSARLDVHNTPQLRHGLNSGRPVEQLSTMRCVARRLAKPTDSTMRPAETFVKAVLRSSLRLLRRAMRIVKRSLRLALSQICRLQTRTTRTSRAFLKRFVFKYLKHQSFRYVFEQEISDWKPDVVHAHDGASLLLAYSVAKKIGARFVYDSHELEAHRSPPLPALQRHQIRTLERRVLPRAAAITTVGEEIAKHLATEYRIDRPTVIFNAPQKRPSTLRGRWGTENLSDVRTDSGLGPTDILLVNTGNVAVGRGIEQTLDALARIKADKAGISVLGPLHLALVGRCQPVVREVLDRRIAEAGLSGRVHFFDPVPANSVTSYISTATISVIPIEPAALSYEYAMPNKLFEALLARLPILSSRLTEMGAFVETHGLGETFAYGDAHEFAEKLARMLEDPQRYLGPSRDETIAQFCWEAQEARLLALFDRFQPSEWAS